MWTQHILTGLIASVITLASPITTADASKALTGIEHLTSPNTPAHLPFSDAVRVGNTVYLSGQIGLIPGTSELANDSFDQEARQVMNNIKTTLETHHMAMTDLVKCTVMLTDIREFGNFNQVYKAFFEAPFPARSAFVVKELALGAQLEVECIAALSH